MAPCCKTRTTVSSLNGASMLLVKLGAGLTCEWGACRAAAAGAAHGIPAKRLQPVCAGECIPHDAPPRALCAAEQVNIQGGVLGGVVERGQREGQAVQGLFAAARG